MKSICVFCGSNVGARPAYVEGARRLGALLARERIGLVFGGGSVGLMGAIADAVLEAGGEATGVIPHALQARELDHSGLTKLHVVGSMHERKAMMARLSDGFIAMPGGMGTLDEFCEIVTWAQLGIHAKPCALFDVEGYFDDFVRFLDTASAQGFVKREHREMILLERDPERLLAAMRAYKPVAAPRWLEPEQT
jgi:uncharacterized protein (TIGR00730 family)